MITSTPEPPVPATADVARRWSGPILDAAGRLELDDGASAFVIAARVVLLCTAWRRVPAASLPSRPAEIWNILKRRLKGARRRQFDAALGEILRGWTLCTDGRLYDFELAAQVNRCLALQRERAGQAPSTSPPRAFAKPLRGFASDDVERPERDDEWERMRRYAPGDPRRYDG